MWIWQAVLLARGAWSEPARSTVASCYKGWREDAHMTVIRALAYGGQREAALTQYDACRRALEQKLGIEPGNELQALVARIRVGELSRQRLGSTIICRRNLRPS
jgi:hypothetical protein